MAGLELPRCLNCGRDEAELPLVALRYRGRPVWICPDCLPILIHKRATLAEKLGPPRDADAEVK